MAMPVSPRFTMCMRPPSTRTPSAFAGTACQRGAAGLDWDGADGRDGVVVQAVTSNINDENRISGRKYRTCPP